MPGIASGLPGSPPSATLPALRKRRGGHPRRWRAESITLPFVNAGLERRVAVAAEEALARRKFVTVADVCIGLGWLHERHVDSWRQGRVSDLEYFLPVHDDRLAQIVVYLQRWAEAHGLKPVRDGLCRRHQRPA